MMRTWSVRCWSDLNGIRRRLAALIRVQVLQLQPAEFLRLVGRIVERTLRSRDVHEDSLVQPNGTLVFQLRVGTAGLVRRLALRLASIGRTDQADHGVALADLVNLVGDRPVIRPMVLKDRVDVQSEQDVADGEAEGVKSRLTALMKTLGLSDMGRPRKAMSVRTCRSDRG